MIYHKVQVQNKKANLFSGGRFMYSRYLIQHRLSHYTYRVCFLVSLLNCQEEVRKKKLRNQQLQFRAICTICAFTSIVHWDDLSSPFSEALNRFPWYDLSWVTNKLTVDGALSLLLKANTTTATKVPCYIFVSRGMPFWHKSIVSEWERYAFF